MRTDIFFTRTTKPICNFVNPAINQGCIMVLSIVMLQNLWNPRLIGNLDIFPLIYPSDIVSINKLTLLLIINGQTHYVFTDKNNNVSLKVYVHYHQYHSSSASVNVCQDLQICHYSMFTVYSQEFFYPSSGSGKRTLSQ